MKIFDLTESINAKLDARAEIIDDLSRQIKEARECCQMTIDWLEENKIDELKLSERTQP